MEISRGDSSSKTNAGLILISDLLLFLTITLYSEPAAATGTVAKFLIVRQTVIRQDYMQTDFTAERVIN